MQAKPWATCALELNQGTQDEAFICKVASLMYRNAFRLKRRSALLTTGVSWDQWSVDQVRDQRPGCDVPLVLATTSVAIPDATKSAVQATGG